MLPLLPIHFDCLSLVCDFHFGCQPFPMMDIFSMMDIFFHDGHILDQKECENQLKKRVGEKLRNKLIKNQLKIKVRLHITCREISKNHFCKNKNPKNRPATLRSRTCY